MISKTSMTNGISQVMLYPGCVKDPDWLLSNTCATGCAGFLQYLLISKYICALFQVCTYLYIYTYIHTDRKSIYTYWIILIWCILIYMYNNVYIYGYFVSFDFFMNCCFLQFFLETSLNHLLRDHCSISTLGEPPSDWNRFLSIRKRRISSTKKLQ